jgi:hypothetical protein
LAQSYCNTCTSFKKDAGFYPIAHAHLARLNGVSSKQIFFGHNMRDDIISWINVYYFGYMTGLLTMTPEEIERGKAALIAAINYQTSAKWWIEHAEMKREATEFLFNDAHQMVIWVNIRTQILA